MTAPDIPVRMRLLARDVAGRPIPWFVAKQADGTFDPRIADAGKRIQALRFGNCWVCGQQTGRLKAFVIGPMCGVNRVTAEPGAHRDCAIYSATACPFLATPHMRRRDSNLPGDRIDPPGVMINRNPGVCLVWVTGRWTAIRTETGPLVSIGDPVETLWFAHGRPATAAQVRESIETGLPLLREACERDDDPAESLRLLDHEVAAAMRLLPSEEPTRA